MGGGIFTLINKTDVHKTWYILIQKRSWKFILNSLSIRHNIG